ncbi:AAA family ATPase [Microbacterium sp. RD1]|uniref:AAA family ATPase n=1 Tax=Microbacterium sp. RD1 TaxID=3457313 RepID=UPI003FA5F3E1
MKLHRLELEGFGPFRERQAVDFDAFADDGIFLIAGRTGAGKSSVLDGVCFALFGGVPRYENGERRLRSDHCDPDDLTEVSLEFSTAGRRWRVTRSPEYERAKKNGTGLTTQSPQALLEVWGDDTWVGVAARPRDVGERLDEIVGLSQQQFLQVILLAQNRFARFLLARNDERQAVLRTLFGTRTYEQYADILDGLRKEASRALESVDERVRMLLDEAERAAATAGLTGDEPVDDGDLPARLGEAVRVVERAAYRAEAAAHEQARADAELDRMLARERTLAALAEQQQQRLDARARLALLDLDAPAIAEAREVLAAARSAEELRGALESVERTRAVADRADAAAAAAVAAWLAAGESAAAPRALQRRDDQLAAIIAACDAALAADAELTEAEAELAAASVSATEADEAIAILDEQRAIVPATLERLAAQLAAVAAAPARREGAAAALAQARQRRDAAREAEDLVAALRDTEREMLARSTELAASTTRHTTLLQRRLASSAGDLAAGLVDGEACPVCGGTEHPHPAAPTSDPVTDADLDDAARAKEAAWEADRVAAEAFETARAAHAAAAARAGGVDLAAAESALAEAETSLTSIEADAASAERLTAERDALTAADAAAAEARTTLVADAARRRQDAALAAQRVAALRQRVDEARGDAPTIGERRSDAERRRGLVRAVRDTAAEAAVHRQVAADAAADRDARLAVSRFADVGEARAALRSTAERAALDERIRAHDAADRADRQRLLELELALADQPDAPIDLAPVRAEVAAARAHVTAAAEARTRATGDLAHLRDLAERADATHRSVSEASARAAVVSRLANTVAGRAPNTHRMTLEAFVLAAELEEIVAAANLRLAAMSSGRYRLQHSDAVAARGASSGLGLEVLDAFTGQARPPQSLSGGETFLASLALALGLAEVVTARAGGIRLDTLFVDEGFGSLDDETLDLAMRTLDELRQGGRTVGVISHVAAMKEQIPAQLVVSAGAAGPSIIRQGSAVPA